MFVCVCFFSIVAVGWRLVIMPVVGLEGASVGYRARIDIRHIQAFVTLHQHETGGNQKTGGQNTLDAVRVRRYR